LAGLLNAFGYDGHNPHSCRHSLEETGLADRGRVLYARLFPLQPLPNLFLFTLAGLRTIPKTRFISKAFYS